MPSVKILVKLTIFKEICFFLFVHVMLGFIVERLASAIYLDRLSLARFWGGPARLSLSISCNFFGAKGHMTGSLPLSIPNNLLVVN